MSLVQFPEAESETRFWGVWLIEGVVFRKHYAVMREEYVSSRVRAWWSLKGF